MRFWAIFVLKIGNYIPKTIIKRKEKDIKLAKNGKKINKIYVNTLFLL